jgi:type I restriction enzyme S subunit
MSKMMKSEKKALVPRFRFPEFRDAGEWFERPLGKQLKLEYGSALPESKRNGGQFPVVGSNGIVGYHSDYLIEGPAIVIGRKGSVGQINWIDSNCYPIDTTYYVENKHPSSASLEFIRLLLENSRLAELKDPGAVPGLNRENVHAVKTAFPEKPEQKRIADCLTSLNALIAAQSEKLDVLKTHKKGLMQQLFPREGETVPRLRFPEFRDAGKWREKKLGDVGSVRMCKRILKEQTTPHGDIPFFKIGTFGSTPDAYISYELFERYRKNFPFPKNGAILISASGTIGRTVRYKGELAYFQDSNIVWLENSGNLISDNFLFYLYQLIDWSPSVGAIQRLYNENILAAKVKFPSIPEQQRVADCLTSLDALITAQTEKLDALKTHKKGLMQQLFPVVEGGRL